MDRRHIEAIYPLSPMQRGMLFHSLYAPGAREYFEQLAITIEGPLDGAAFGLAWRRVVDRHPVLRTQFVWKDRDEPLQVVRRQVRLPWASHDLRGLPAGEVERRLEALGRADEEQGLELSSAPLIRLTLVRAAEELHYLVWSFHHAVLDRWSVGLVLREVSQVYLELVQGREPEPGVGPAYQDYVRWCFRQDRSRAQEFWTRTLKDFRAPTALRTGSGAKPAASSTSYRLDRISVPPATTAAINALAREHRLTLNTLLQAAWALVLSRDAGCDDVVHGITVSTRPAEVPGIDTMVGCLLNTLPLRVRVDPAETVVSWLRQIQTQLLELREHEYSSLVDIQGWSQVPRGLPLFESLVVLQNIRMPDLKSEGGRFDFRIIRAFEPRTGYPLTVGAGQDGGEVYMTMVHDSSRVEAPAAERLLRRLGAFLEGLAAAPDRPLSALPTAGEDAELPPAPLAYLQARAEPALLSGPPDGPVETTLAAIWKEVLGRETVGRHDHFFDLGGHSLNATLVISRVRRAFGVELAVGVLFEAPTLAALAQRIMAAQGAGPGSDSVPALRRREVNGRGRPAASSKRSM